MPRPEFGVAVNAAIAEENIFEPAAAFSAELKRAATGRQHAIRDGEVFGWTKIAQRRAGFGDNRVIPGFHKAIGDANVAAAIWIDAVAVPVPNRDAKDVHKIAAEETDIVIGRIVDGEIP